MHKVAVRPYKPGRYGKGTVPDEAKPQAQIWRVKKWDGSPHHDDVAEALGISKPQVTFHIDEAGRFFFHHSGEGHLKPRNPAKLAGAIVKQHPGLRWGGESVEAHESSAKHLAIANRPLRDFEQGAHLHVLDWAHSTARQRFGAAGAVQVKAAAKAYADMSADMSKRPHLQPPQLPALEAAITAELRKLYALGHATVRSELDHQANGRNLPIGLSAAPAPPNLRTAKAKKGRHPHCANCQMFEQGTCWGYGNYPVKPNQLCDSYERDPDVKTLAVSDSHRDPGALRARAQLVAAHVAHQIWQAVQRGRLGGISDQAQLRALGQAAGDGALRSEASLHAGAAISSGRHAAAIQARAQIVGARYTSVLDKSTCGPCADADTGELIALGSPEWVPTPNPACLGGARCRCIHVYQLATETAAQPIAAGG